MIVIDDLLDDLRTATGRPELDFCADPQPLTGGFWAELVSFELGDPPAGWGGELVARVMPEPLMAAKETAVQSVVAQAGVPTPAVRGAGGVESRLGRAWMVMDKASGVPLLAGLNGLGAIVGAPRRLWRMPDILASVMARLHAVDPAPIRAELDRLRAIGVPAVTVPEMIETLHDWAAGLERSDLEGAAHWLLAHPRPAGETVVCHGDLHPFNVLVDEAGQVTLLDWSAAVLGPRAYDFAFTTLMLANPPLAVPPAVRGTVRAAGRVLAGRFGRRYRRYSGTRPDALDVRWHQAVVGLRALVEVAQWVRDGVVDQRAGHPWLVSGDRLAEVLSVVTGVAVRSR